MMALPIVPRNGAEIDELISDKRANRQPMSVCRAERTSFGAAFKSGNETQSGHSASNPNAEQVQTAFETATA